MDDSYDLFWRNTDRMCFRWKSLSVNVVMERISIWYVGSNGNTDKSHQHQVGPSGDACKRDKDNMMTSSKNIETCMCSIRMGVEVGLALNSNI